MFSSLQVLGYHCTTCDIIKNRSPTACLDGNCPREADNLVNENEEEALTPSNVLDHQIKGVQELLASQVFPLTHKYWYSSAQDASIFISI